MGALKSSTMAALATFSQKATELVHDREFMVLFALSCFTAALSIMIIHLVYATHRSWK